MHHYSHAALAGAYVSAQTTHMASGSGGDDEQRPAVTAIRTTPTRAAQVTRRAVNGMTSSPKYVAKIINKTRKKLNKYETDIRVL